MKKQKYKSKKQILWTRIMEPSQAGFTLIELSIVMIIIGIITAAIFKGQDLIETARLQATLSEFNRIKMMLIQYREQYGQWPGNDPHANERFRNATDGDGGGFIRESESPHVWKHLAKGGLLESEDSPPAKIGGNFMVRSNPSESSKGNWIVLSGKVGTMQSILTPKQALQLKSKLDESAPDKGQLRVMDGEDVGENKCLAGNTYNIKNTSPSCVVMMSF